MRRTLLLPAILLALASILGSAALAGSSGATWTPIDPNIQYLRDGSSIVAYYLRPCAGGKKQVAVQPLTPSGLGPVSLLNKCGEYIAVSQPSAAANPVTHQLWVAFSAITPGGIKGKSYIVAASSSDGGQSFHKEIRLHQVPKKIAPPMVSVASYAKALFVDWADFNPAAAKPNLFHIEQIDPRFGDRVSMTGLSNYKVMPVPDALRVYAGHWGVLTFWEAKKGGSYIWHVADSQRINPNDFKKSVRMFYRGVSGDVNETEIVPGEDGNIYRFESSSKYVAAQGQTVLTITLSRWAFAQHAFIPVGKTPLLNVNYKGLLTFLRPLIAETVGPDGHAYIAYRSGNSVLCTGLAVISCVGATNGQPFPADITVAAVDPVSGQVQSGQVQWPVRAQGSQAIFLALNGQSLLIASGGVRLVAPYSLAPVVKAAADGNYQIGTPVSAYFESPLIALH